MVSDQLYSTRSRSEERRVIYVAIEENIICIHSIRKTVNNFISTTSSRLCISIKEKYWDVQTDNLRQMMARMDEDYILDAIYLLRHENPEYHESIINRLISEYDEYSVSCEGDGTDSAVSDELN